MCAVPAQAIDVDAAVRSALDGAPTSASRRTASQQNDIGIRYLRNQTLPEVNAGCQLQPIGVGGTELRR